MFSLYAYHDANSLKLNTILEIDQLCLCVPIQVLVPVLSNVGFVLEVTFMLEIEQYHGNWKADFI